MYRRKYVAFIDLLGFSNLVKASAEKAGPPHEVYAVLDLFQNSVQTAVDGGLRASQFSDCLVLSADADPDGLLNLFSAVKTIADNLLQIDMLVRGAVTVGPFIHDDNVVFGPPLPAVPEAHCAGGEIGARTALKRASHLRELGWISIPPPNAGPSPPL